MHIIKSPLTAKEVNELYYNILLKITARDGAIDEKMGDICAEMRCFNTDMDEVLSKDAM